MIDHVTDPLISPEELRKMHPHLGLRLQRERRRAGSFIPHLRMGDGPSARIYYRLSSIEKYLAEAEQTIQVDAVNGGEDHDDDAA